MHRIPTIWCTRSSRSLNFFDAASQPRGFDRGLPSNVHRQGASILNCSRGFSRTIGVRRLFQDVVSGNDDIRGCSTTFLEDPEILLSRKSPKQELDRLTEALEQLGGHFWVLAARLTKFLLHDLITFPFNLQVLHYLGPIVHYPNQIARWTTNDQPASCQHREVRCFYSEILHRDIHLFLSLIRRISDLRHHQATREVDTDEGLSPLEDV
jgi:hypothetical protein